jgi:hypothetical protein
MPALQAALKTAGDGLFSVRGSSPDLSASAQRSRRGGPGSSQATVPFKTKATTLTDGGVGEQLPYARPKRGIVLAVVGLAAVAAGALFVVRSRAHKGDDQTAVEAPSANAAGDKRATPAVAAPTISPPAAPATVTVVIETTPPGARVMGTDDGQTLGETPLTLVRNAKSPDLKVRIEKEGYVGVSRRVPLLRDETLDLTLERKPRPARPKKPVVDEPARL